MCVGGRVWMGVWRPCPPVHNNIVTPHHLFLLVTITFVVTCYAFYTPFLVACYATLHPALSVHRSIGLSHFTFFGFLWSLASQLLPIWSSDLKCGPRPPPRDWGSRVSGLGLYEWRENCHSRVVILLILLSNNDVLGIRNSPTKWLNPLTNRLV